MVAAIILAIATGLFTAYGMGFPRFATWLARIQFMPAAIAFAMGILIVWIIVTLIFGRIYCSTVCPMGLFQDVMARLPRLSRRSRNKRPYHYRRPASVSRYTILIITVAAFVGGISIVPAVVDPYSAFGRIAANIIKPVWGSVLNLGNDIGLWQSAPVRVALASLSGFSIAVATAIAVGWIAARSGRTVCNTVCPVGTTLGLIGRYSIFHIDIDTDKCIQCRKCEHVCKSSCIDMNSHVIDMSRCVVCFDCLPVCPNDAITYTPSSHRLVLPMLMRINDRRSTAPTAIDTPATDDTSAPRRLDRRRFIATIAAGALAPLVAKAAGAASDAARVTMPAKIKPTPSNPVYPPGAPDRDYLTDHCTGCGLCVAHCPTGVLIPSTRQYGVFHALTPLLDFELGRCAWNCTMCNNLCPTGALFPLTLKEKQATVIGRATVIPTNCIHCGKCARVCPRNAITMEGAGAPVPVVNPSLCIGCGACQEACPAFPYKAIYVEGMP